MKNIHPTAIIEKGAQIADTASVGPYCVIGPHVILKDKVVLKSHVVIDGRTTIGEGTVVYPFASLGSPPQDLKYDGEPSELIIGKNNVIREYVTMNPGTKAGAMKTTVGDNGLFMISCHIAHDCVIGNNVIMANNASLAGHVTLGDYAILGGLAAVHQFIRIGDHAMIGGATAVDGDVIPYGRVRGERGSLMGLNLVGLERRGFNKDQIKSMQKAVNQLFADEGTLEDRLNEVESDFGKDEGVRKILDFAREKTKFPLCQPQKKAR